LIWAVLISRTPTLNQRVVGSSPTAPTNNSRLTGLSVQASPSEGNRQGNTCSNPRRGWCHAYQRGCFSARPGCLFDPGFGLLRMSFRIWPGRRPSRNQRRAAKTIGRRELLRGGGVAAIAVAGAAGVLPFGGAVGASSAMALPVVGGGELAELIRLYWKQVDYFNSASHVSDEDSEALAASTYEATLHRLAEAPVRTREDAFAAIEWILREAKEDGIDIGPLYDDYLYSRIATRFLTEAKNFLAEGVRS
jgi:hypothetical protein